MDFAYIMYCSAQLNVIVFVFCEDEATAGIPSGCLRQGKESIGTVISEGYHWQNMPYGFSQSR